MRQASPVFQVSEHESAVASVAVRGHRVLSASLDGCAILWDMRAGPKSLEEVCFHTLSDVHPEVWDEGSRQLAHFEGVRILHAGHLACDDKACRVESTVLNEAHVFPSLK